MEEQLISGDIIQVKLINSLGYAYLKTRKSKTPIIKFGVNFGFEYYFFPLNILKKEPLSNISDLVNIEHLCGALSMIRIPRRKIVKGEKQLIKFIGTIPLNPYEDRNIFLRHCANHHLSWDDESLLAWDLVFLDTEDQIESNKHGFKFEEIEHLSISGGWSKDYFIWLLSLIWLYRLNIDTKEYINQYADEKEISGILNLDSIARQVVFYPELDKDYWNNIPSLN